MQSCPAEKLLTYTRTYSPCFTADVLRYFEISFYPNRNNPDCNPDPNPDGNPDPNPNCNPDPNPNCNPDSCEGEGLERKNKQAKFVDGPSIEI